MTVTVYTLQNCGLCRVAKELLKFKEVPYTEVKIPEDMPKKEFVAKYPDVRQFPLVLDEEGGIIGSFKDVQGWLLEKEKKELLNKQVSGLTI